MSYTPHNFVNGEIIEAEPINEMDRQIQTNETNIGLKLNKSDVYNGLDYTEEGKALDARQGRALNQAVGGKISSTEKGAANGVAELDSNGKVPSSQLPSYVDDIIEGYYYNGKFYKEAAHTTEITGETGKIYVDLASEKTYRWGGSEYVEISASLALGETSSTAYRGDRGKAAYDHATDANRLTTAQTEGLYKVATTAEGHIKSVSAVEKSDIMALGIPGSQPDVSGKADKVSDPTSGNFAGLDENGNLTDSGKKPSDFLTQHQDISGKADKDTDAVVGNFAAFDSNGNPVDSGHKHSDYITSHQDISGKADKVSGATNGNFAGLDSNGNLTDSGHKHSDYLTEHQDISGKLDVSEKGEANGVAELDSAGKVPTSQLPSYVDDVVEYSSISEFPATGESGKIYVDTSTNKTYRWGGSEYVAISSDLALGETSSTAYRGDRGAAAYAHGVTNKGSQYSTGLYKIGTNSEGHVNAAVAVTKQDIVDLGIPGEAGDASALHEIEFSLATTDWTLSSGVYTATVTNSYICSTSVDFVMYSSSINSYLMDNIETEKDATNHTLTFKTGAMPTGTITGTIYSLANNDGQTAVALIDEKLPIENGGTNATTASAARDNLGVAARSNLAIVEDTDTATHAIAAGQYVIWKGATCVASSAITIGDTLSASNLTTKSGGVANDILAQKGVANGFASLDSNGLIPSNQLPSYVDDVQEYNNTSAFPATGETGKIYVAKDTNKSYRWSGSGYIELSSYAVATQSASGLMSATDKTKLDGIAQSTLVNVPFSIATTDWTLSNGVYTAEFTTSYVTTNSKEIVQYDYSLRTYGAYDIDVAKKSGGGGMVFTTMIIPTGTISGNIFVFANEDGNIAIVVVDNVLPVTAGGTGATTEAGARTALGLGDAAQKTVSDTSTAAAIADDTNLPTDRTVRNAIYNGLDQTNAGYMLDARQGKAISNTIGTVPSGKTVQGQIDTLNTQFANLVGHVNIDATTSGNANIDLSSYIGNSYIPLIFKGNIYNDTTPVYCSFGEWSVANHENAMKVFDYRITNGQLANTRVVGTLYYLKVT